MDDDESKIAEKYEALHDVMDEQMRRLWAATEARALGYGGVSTVARAVGLTRPTITAGMKELGDARGIVPMARKHRVRREGAGRPRATDIDVGLRPALEDLVEPATRGHPMSPFRWTTMASLHLIPGKFHGDWKYALAPGKTDRIKKQPRKLRPKL